MRRFTFAACVVAGLLATATAQAQQPEWAMPDILAAAKAEGQVTVYSSTNEQEGLPLWKLFEDATGIKVNYVRAADAALMGKIAIEARSGQQSWDVINTPTANQLPEAVMAQFDPPLAKAVMPSARDPNRRWYGVYANYNSPAYNTNLVKAEDLPKTYEDFLKKTDWVGKVAIEGTDNEWMNAIFAHYGEAKGKKLISDLVSTLKVVVLDGHLAAAAAAVHAGDVAAADATGGDLDEHFAGGCGGFGKFEVVIELGGGSKDERFHGERGSCPEWGRRQEGKFGFVLVLDYIAPAGCCGVGELKTANCELKIGN